VPKELEKSMTTPKHYSDENEKLGTSIRENGKALRC
jgi:hypothetical protein